MIQSPSTTAITPADHAHQPARHDGSSAHHAPFRLTLATQFQSPIAQHLLGDDDEDARLRQKQPGAPISITELSGRAIAHLGTSAAGAGEPPPQPAQPRAAGAPPRRDVPERESTAALAPRSDPAHQTTPRALQPSQHAQHQPAAGSSSPAPAAQRTPPARRTQSPSPSGAQPARPAPSATAPQQVAVRAQPASNAGSRADSSAAARTLSTAQRHFRIEIAPQSAARPHQHAAPAEDEQRFAAQLSRGLAAVLRQGGGTLTMRLNPRALGDLTIQMNLAPGNVGATFTAATTQARDLLHDSLTHLRAALEARGLEVERLDVHLANAAEPQAPNRSPDDGTEGHEKDPGGAGKQGTDAHGRRESPHTTASGGAAGSTRSPERDPEQESDRWLQDAPAHAHAALRLWMQQSEGGAHTIRLCLDAVA